MKIRMLISVCGLLAIATLSAQAQTPVEVKLIAAFEEDRGWCLDLRGGQPNAQPIGGLHGHTCYTYQGNGPSRDQGFVLERIHEISEFRMVEFNDKCMTLYEPEAGSFISMENCDGRAAQQIEIDESGQIRPTHKPELCLTIGETVLPGGGGRPLHIMRDVTFEDCNSDIGERQRWELRNEYDGPQATTAERPFKSNPNAAPPGRGAGMDMGAEN
jgi:hypothetical protein